VREQDAAGATATRLQRCGAEPWGRAGKSAVRIVSHAMKTVSRNSTIHVDETKIVAFIKFSGHRMARYSNLEW
jgi:hypothetical protein